MRAQLKQMETYSGGDSESYLVDRFSTSPLTTHR